MSPFSATGDGLLSRIDALGVSYTMSHTGTPWRNATNPNDVNNDGNVAPIDALLVINYLKYWGERVLADNPYPNYPNRYLDVNGDNVLSVLDAELVSNHLSNLPPPAPAWRNEDHPLDIDNSGSVNHSDQAALNAALPAGYGQSYDYLLAEVDEVHFRTHELHDQALLRVVSKLVPGWMFGGDDNDFLHAFSADDLLYGGAGNDDLYGNAGDDELYGEEGDDDLWGGSGDDLFNGGPGNNTYHDDEITAEGDSVETEQNVPVAITLHATDVDNDPLTFTIVSPTQHGTLIGDAPDLVYKPYTDYIGADSFTFQASDGTYESNVAVVNVGVEYPPPPNQAPVAVDDYYELDDDEQISLFASVLISNDTDADNDAISFVAIITPPARGQLQEISSGEWRYTPNTATYGTDYLEYKITDGKDYATGRVYLTVFRSDHVWGDLWALQYLAPDLNAKEHPENLEGNPGPGIGLRRNGDDDNANTVADRAESPVAAENDMLYAGVRFNENMSIIQSVYSIQLRRSNDAIQLWRGQTKTEVYFAAGSNSATYAAAPLGLRHDNFFVEWVSNDSAVTSATLEVAFVGNGGEYITDALVFRPFKSLVIGFVGEHQNAGDPTIGMRQLVAKLRNEGYDALVFDEDDISYDSPFSYVEGLVNDVILADYAPGQGQAQQKSIAEAVNAIRNRGVTELGLIGYSHGGGAVHELATALQTEFGAGYTDFDLKYTAYVDAVRKQSAFAETRLPPETEYHVNLWQSGPPVASWLRLVQGAEVAGANANDDVDSGDDGLFHFVPERLHTNRKTFLTGERRGIMETEPLQAAIISGTIAPDGTDIYAGLNEKVNRF